MVERAEVTRDPELQALLDERAITAVIARYARTLDWLDDAGQASCYWPDAAINYGFFSGTAADFVPVVMNIERSTGRRWHMLSGLQIKLHGADRASSECYGIATATREGADGIHSGNVFGGRYLDEFEKRGDEWRISRRDYILDWSMPLPPQHIGGDGPAGALPMLDLSASGHPRYRPM